MDYYKKEMDKMSNEVKINKKEYLCENGIIYLIPENHCPFCKHCASIFYDYTNGPYMFLCEVANGDPETCGKFEKR